MRVIYELSFSGNYSDDRFDKLHQLILSSKKYNKWHWKTCFFRANGILKLSVYEESCDDVFIFSTEFIGVLNELSNACNEYDVFILLHIEKEDDELFKVEIPSDYFRQLSQYSVGFGVTIV